MNTKLRLLLVAPLVLGCSVAWSQDADDDAPELPQQAAEQAMGADRAFQPPIVNIEAQPYNGSAPPDTVGEIGANHYIHMINGAGATTSMEMFIVYRALDKFLAGKGANYNALSAVVEDPATGWDAAWGIRAKLSRA